MSKATSDIRYRGPDVAFGRTLRCLGSRMRRAALIATTIIVVCGCALTPLNAESAKNNIITATSTLSARDASSWRLIQRNKTDGRETEQSELMALGTEDSDERPFVFVEVSPIQLLEALHAWQCCNDADHDECESMKSFIDRELQRPAEALYGNEMFRWTFHTEGGADEDGVTGTPAPEVGRRGETPTDLVLFGPFNPIPQSVTLTFSHPRARGDGSHCNALQAQSVIPKARW